jgi:micrococcal nuclease
MDFNGGSFWVPVQYYRRVKFRRNKSNKAIVLDVIDGDTFRCAYRGNVITCRLNAIDTPELSQSYGYNARQKLFSLINSKEVELIICNTGRYGRLIVFVQVNGIDINLELIKAGAAWCYNKYCPVEKRSVYNAEQSLATAAKRGLWAYKNPIPPWSYRAEIIK